MPPSFTPLSLCLSQTAQLKDKTGDILYFCYYQHIPLKDQNPQRIRSQPQAHFLLLNI